MAMNYAEACSMQSVAAESGQTLGIAYYRRMYPKVNRALELVRDGAVGRPVLAEAANHFWFHPADGFRSWLIEPEMAGGGPLYDIASHRIDLMNYFFGRPVNVAAQGSALVHDTRVEDNATLLVEYESSVRGIIDVRWHSRVPRDEFRIRGIDGDIDLTPLNSPRLTHPGGEESLPPHDNLHYPCVANFVDAVLDGAPLRSSGASALVTDWITQYACQSMGFAVGKISA
jgi:predicted dehydrogenase